tara:strand:- start:103 stop:1326 length:1224 start_codon:yes stop_codon:yes gene_type:complete
MIEKININKVLSNPNNPRLIKDYKFKQLVKSIKEFPEMLEKRPIVVDEAMIVLGGNMRLKACKEAGLKDIWIDVVNDWSDNQKEQFIIKDNIGFGEWDWEILANEWNPEELKEWGLEGFPFEDEVLEAEEDNYEAPTDIQTKIQLGDLITIGEHRLLCGDSTDSDQVAKLMNGEKADMVFTDPPYNINFKGTLSCTTKNGKIITMKEGYSTPNSEYEDIKNDKKTKQDFNNFISSVISIIKLNTIGGWYICFSSSTLNELLNPLVNLEMNWKSIIIWNKNQSPLGGGHFRKKYEPIVYGYFKNNFYGKEYSEDDVWDIDRTKKNDLHPTMKPITLIEKAIGYSSKIEGSVLDLFIGSGSTMVAAHQLERKCYGMELDPKYCQVIIDRMLKLDSTLIVEVNGKKYERK